MRHSLALTTQSALTLHSYSFPRLIFKEHRARRLACEDSLNEASTRKTPNANVVELIGFEPMTSAVQGRRSPN